MRTLEKNAEREKLITNKKDYFRWNLGDKEFKQLVAEKHRYFNDYKLMQSAESFVSIKKYRNLVNRKLKEAEIQFSEYLKPQKRNGNSLGKKLERKITVQIPMKLIKFVKKRKTKSQSVTHLADFSVKWASTEGSLFR